MMYRVIDEDGRIIGTTQYFTPTNEPTKKKIALVVGHDSKRQGAFGSSGISEYRFNSELIQAIRVQCQNLNIEVFYRDEKIKGYTKQMVDLHKRLDEANIDYAIELHFNGAGDSSIQGHEILYCSDKGKQLAKVLDEKFDKYLDNKDRDIKKVTKDDRGGGFVCRGKSVCLIAEPFFSAHQHKYVMGTDGRKALIRAYCEFIREVSHV